MSTVAVEKQLRRFKRQVTQMVKGPEIPPFPDVPYPAVNLVYWRPKQGSNFGDELSRTVVQLMLARRGITIEDETRERRRLLAIGSVLHQAEDDTVVWGSGRNGAIPDRAHFFDRIDVRAVRGPRTAEFLEARGIAVPEVYGDPALLLPRLLGDRFKRGTGKGPVFVPNLNDFREAVDFSKLSIPVIDPRQSWNVAVRAILAHDFVVASSLHGLIVAEAFGIPARYVRVTEHEGLFKYDDYYSGTGRPSFDVAKSVPEALEMGGAPAPKVDLDALAAAFPYDLWEA